MEISTEKSKVMVAGKQENTENQVVTVLVNGVQLEQVKNFTYLGARIEDNGKSDMEVRMRIGRATSALARMDNIWRVGHIRIMDNKLLLMRAIVLATLLYACESWTVRKKDEQRLRAFEMKTYRRLLGISWKEKKTNEWVLQEVRRICGQELEGFVEIVKKRKLKLYGNEMRRGGLLKTVIEESMEGRRGRGRGRPRRSWFTDVKEWTGERGAKITQMAKDREQWRRRVHE